ncbi:hypothetical protein ACPXCE_00070 [Streptomyces sp. DT24]|uniref:hypothetical protein n=1 Tax=unclassified Streptomyces TaxID=2593676 RepID=UPI0023B88D3A|nr:hypothetical protein [Streptomyces sp. AM 4-1-1]WEH36431.1 hypothetical protein PZB75_25585 [Streptomyces sp. AM 4-1-1]
MRRKRRAIGAAALAAAAAGTMLAVAAPAQAAPGNCTISTSNPVSSLCTTGTGYHRIHMVLNALDPRLPQRIILGDWAPVGQKSVASNPWGSQYIVNVWVDRTD